MPASLLRKWPTTFASRNALECYLCRYLVLRFCSDFPTSEPGALTADVILVFVNQPGVNLGRVILAGAAIALAGSLCAFQMAFREYPAIGYSSFPLPADYQEQTEFAFARLMYPPAPHARFDRAGKDWAHGRSSWTQDYPRADRHFLLALRRLSRIHSRSVEQPVNLDDGDDVFNWPWLYAVRPGEWNLTDSQAAKRCAITFCAEASSWPTISGGTSSGTFS